MVEVKNLTDRLDSIKLRDGSYSSRDVRAVRVTHRDMDEIMKAPAHSGRFASRGVRDLGSGWACSVTKEGLTFLCRLAHGEYTVRYTGKVPKAFVGIG